VLLYWFLLLGFIGEMGSPKYRNPMLVPLTTALIGFGIWRVVRKWRRRRREAMTLERRPSVRGADAYDRTGQ
jgi:hypothetical protein